MKLEDFSKNYPIDQLGSSSGNYLKFDEGIGDWTVVHLNCLQRLIRWIGLAYGSTTLPYIAEKMSLEVNVDPALLNKIHQLWHATYPSQRSPLKTDPCSFVDFNGRLLGGKVKPETMKIGETKISLMPAEKSTFPHLITLMVGNKALSPDIIEELLIDELTAPCLEGIENIALKIDSNIPSHGFMPVVKTVLSFLEKYVYENPNRFAQINLLFTDEDSGSLIDSIDLWRGMEHPHALFHEI